MDKHCTMKITNSTYSAPFAFLPERLTRYESAKTVIAPLPYDATTSWMSGTQAGPSAIIEASEALELFDEHLGWEPCELGICTLDPLEPDARGPQQQVEAVRKHLAGPIKDEKFVLSLGGEHSLTIGCVESILDSSTEPMSILQIDAHADLRDKYQGSQYSHACVMRRLITHCDPVQVGIRSYSKEEYLFMKENDLHPWTMDRIYETSDWIEQVVSELGHRVYVTVDLDGFDPAYCPGVGTPEPGGLNWKQVTDLLQGVFSSRHVVAADIMECRPIPPDRSTEYLAARLAYRMIGLRFSQENRGY